MPAASAAKRLATPLSVFGVPLLGCCRRGGPQRTVSHHTFIVCSFLFPYLVCKYKAAVQPPNGTRVPMS